MTLGHSGSHAWHNTTFRLVVGSDCQERTLDWAWSRMVFSRKFTVPVVAHTVSRFWLTHNVHLIEFSALSYSIHGKSFFQPGTNARWTTGDDSALINETSKINSTYPIHAFIDIPVICQLGWGYGRRRRNEKPCYSDRICITLLFRR